MESAIQIFTGGRVTDQRGSVAFNNSFNFTNIKRFYQLENTPTQPIRAFHGHMKEAKYFYVVSGTILLCLAPLDNPQRPSKKTKIERFILTAKEPKIVYVPPGFANGFKSLSDDAKVIVFSNATLEESKHDDYRYPDDYWGTEIWETKNEL